MQVFMRDEHGDWKDEGEVKSDYFKKEPAINVISKEVLEERTKKVFHILWETLAKSFGPYGAPTIICRYPFRHITKDGYTIMKSLSMDASETLTDQAIADMAADICGRLNYSVGDGTTSAIIATNSIYEAYQNAKDNFNKKKVLPRDIIYEFNNIKNEVIEKLNGKARQIKSDNLDELADNIRDVVYISSNADVELTNNITELYRKLGAPAIACKLADDGVGKCEVIEGYQNDLTLIDQLYINDDNYIMDLRKADVIIFSIKVTQEIYEKILKPLNTECKTRNRHLIVAAPKFDEAAIANLISRDLSEEKRKTGDINMVLCTYSAISAHKRQLIEDFATLTDTTVLDRVMVENILNNLSVGNHICKVFNIDSRNIKGLEEVYLSADGKSAMLVRNGEEAPDEGFVNLNECANGKLLDGYVRLGFVNNARMGLKVSTFSDFIYDKERYNAALMSAEKDLKEKEEKYKKLGTFNLEVSQAQQRLYSLRLKMGIIEIGADSELSQALSKDAADDAVKAAASAYHYGVVLGCNVSLLQSILEVISETSKENSDNADIKKELLEILYVGFRSVYGTVLTNAFDDGYIHFDLFSGQQDHCIDIIKNYLYESGYITSLEDFPEVSEDVIKLYDERVYSRGISQITVFDAIVDVSIVSSTVYDVSKREFNKSVINSAQTDREILTATIDLIGLLITGNQMVVTQKTSF